MHNLAYCFSKKVFCLSSIFRLYNVAKRHYWQHGTGFGEITAEISTQLHGKPTEYTNSGLANITYHQLNRLVIFTNIHHPN